MQLFSRWAVVFDRNGAPVWWYRASGEADNFQILPDGTIAFDDFSAADASGALFDVSIPGGPGCIDGDGWTVGGPPSRTLWKYRNRSGALPPACLPGSAQGITLVQIKDTRQSSKQALQFKAKAKAATLLRDPDLPLTRIQVDFALAAQPAPGVASPQARAGQCAEALFTGNPIPASPKPSCKTKTKNGGVDGVNCKGR